MEDLLLPAAGVLLVSLGIIRAVLALAPRGRDPECMYVEHLATRAGGSPVDRD